LGAAAAGTSDAERSLKVGRVTSFAGQALVGVVLAGRAGRGAGHAVVGAGEPGVSAGRDAPVKLVVKSATCALRACMVAIEVGGVDPPGIAVGLAGRDLEVRRCTVLVALGAGCGGAIALQARGIAIY